MGRRRLALLIVVLVALSMAGYAYYVYNEYRKIDIGSIAITGMEFKRPAAGSGGLGALRVKFSIEVVNPGRMGVEVDRIDYEVSVEGLDIGSGTLESVSVPAGSNVTLEISIDVPLDKALVLIPRIMAEPGRPLDIVVRGTAHAKPRVLGITLPEISVPFEKHLEYSLANWVSG